jgi:hypothetical protein
MIQYYLPNKLGIGLKIKRVGDKLSDVGKYLWDKGLPSFFDKLRDFCYSPIGIGLDVALTVAIPAAGKVVMSVVFGALLLWEIKELIEKGPGWETILNVIFAAIGVLVPALSKSGKAAVGGAKSLGAIPVASRGIIVKMIEMGKSMVGKIVRGAGKGAEWLAGLFGPGAKSWMSGILKSLESTLTKVFNSVSGKLVGGGEKLTKSRLSTGISKGIKTGVIWATVNFTLEEFLKTETGQKIINRVRKLFGYSDEELKNGDILTNGIKKSIISDNPSMKLTDSSKIEIKYDKNKNATIIIDGVKYKFKDNAEEKLLLTPITNSSNNIINDYDSLWDYMEKDGKYYTKKKNSDTWLLTKGNVESSIKNKVFKK